jgi:hypothetical protein
MLASCPTRPAHHVVLEVDTLPIYVLTRSWFGGSPETPRQQGTRCKSGTAPQR